MSERTFKREDLDRARAEWEAGKFSDEWDSFRALAWRGGLIFPPDGTRWDSWEDDEPSQRAMLIRAIRETPELLEKSIIGAGSWGIVIGRLLKGRDDMREEVLLAEKDDTWRRQDEPTGPQALRRLGEIVGRIQESVR
jgi:hypothetical protein